MLSVWNSKLIVTEFLTVKINWVKFYRCSLNLRENGCICKVAFSFLIHYQIVSNSSFIQEYEGLSWFWGKPPTLSPHPLGSSSPVLGLQVCTSLDMFTRLSALLSPLFHSEPLQETHSPTLFVCSQQGNLRWIIRSLLYISFLGYVSQKYSF